MKYIPQGISLGRSEGFGGLMALSYSKMETWHAALAKAVANRDTSDFPETLERALGHLVDFDICMVFSYSDDQTVQCLHHNMAPEKAKIVVNRYLTGPYLLDPFYEEAKRGRRDGSCALQQLAPDRFYRSEYYLHHYARTGIADEMGIFFPIAPDTTAILSVARQQQKRRFSRAERDAFALAAPVVGALGDAYWQNRPSSGTLVFDLPFDAHAAIESAFKNFGQDILTTREREVVTLVLKGHSSASIAHILSISPGTVKIHRKNAYDKLCISSQAELFSKFIEALNQV